MVTTRYQAKRRRLDMDSAIGRREGFAGCQRQADEATGDTRKIARNNTLPPCAIDVYPKGAAIQIPGNSCRRTISKRSKKSSFCAFKNRQRNDAVRTAHDCIKPESHDTFLHVRAIGENADGPRGSVSAIGHDYFRFRCPLGDVWHDAYADVCRHRTVRTGDPWIDRALRSIPFQGYDITHFVGAGKFSYVLAGNCSQKYVGMVALKMLKREVAGPKDVTKLKTPLRTLLEWAAQHAFPDNGSVRECQQQEGESEGLPDKIVLVLFPSTKWFDNFRFIFKRATAELIITQIAPWHVEYPEEVEIHRTLDHRNIVKWLDYMTYMQRKCIIMEFCHLGGLDELLEATSGKMLTEQVAKKYFIQMVDAIEYIHSMDVVHCDIVCSNWVIDRHNVIKLIDFGSAKHWSNTEPLMTERPPSAAAYLSPEPLFGEAYDPKCVDIWALGVVLFRIVTSSLPFGEEPVFHPGVVTTLPYPKESVLPLSLPVKDLLNNILHSHQASRFTINRIKQCYWFKQDSTKFYVSNHFLGRQPLKIKEGPLERRWKQASGLHKPQVVHKAWIPPKPKVRIIRIVKLKLKDGSQFCRPSSALGLGAEVPKELSDRGVSEESTGTPQCTSSVSAVASLAETLRNVRDRSVEDREEEN